MSLYEDAACARPHLLPSIPVPSRPEHCLAVFCALPVVYPPRPFLLDGYPSKLAQDKLRKDAIATTLIRMHGGGRRRREEERRVTVVERVVVDATSSAPLRRALDAHPHALNPVVAAPEGAGWKGPTVPRVDSPIRALLRERLHASSLLQQQRVRWQRGSVMLTVNAVAILVNILVASRALRLWGVVEKHQVVDWIQRIQPHAETTIVAVRWVNLATWPLRTGARLIGTGLRAAGGAAKGRAVILSASVNRLRGAVPS